MAKKRLDVTDITNDLQHSAFFPAAQPTAPVEPVVPSAQVQPNASDTPLPSLTAALPEAQERAENAENAALGARREERQQERQQERQLASEHASASARPQASMHASPHASMLAHNHARMPATMSATMPDSNSASTSWERSRNLMTDSETPAMPHAERAETAGAERAPDISDHTSLVVQPSVIEGIRRRVRQIGKEVSFVRLTPEEKRQLTDIAYQYKSQGVKTSENEISRIGINWMLDDHLAHGATSVLARVLAALNA